METNLHIVGFVLLAPLLCVVDRSHGDRRGLLQTATGTRVDRKLAELSATYVCC